MIKKTFTLSLMCLFAIAAFAQNLTKETRNVPSFTGLDASSAFTIELKKGPTPSVVIECEPQYLPHIRTEVANGVLKLYYHNNDVIRVRTRTPFKAYITTSELDYLDLSGACTLTSSDLFTPARFKVDLSGASKVTGLRIDTKDASIETSGAANLSMEIHCDRASCDISGASKNSINGVIKQIDIDISGASKASYSLKSERMTIEASSGSTVTLEGEANQTKISLSSAATLSAEQCTVKEMELSASSASRANVYVTETLSPHLSSAAKLNYKGAPRITNLKVGSGATINGHGDK